MACTVFTTMNVQTLWGKLVFFKAVIRGCEPAHLFALFACRSQHISITCLIKFKYHPTGGASLLGSEANRHSRFSAPPLHQLIELVCCMSRENWNEFYLVNQFTVKHTYLYSLLAWFVSSARHTALYVTAERQGILLIFGQAASLQENFYRLEVNSKIARDVICMKHWHPSLRRGFYKHDS